MSALKELRSQQEKLLHDARDELSKLDDDKLQDGEAAEIEARHDTIMADYDRIEGRATRLEDLERRSEALNAPDPRRPVGEPRSANGREQRGVTTEDAFRSYLVHGVNGMAAEERSMLIRESRAMSVGTPSAGGYTVPTTLAAEIIKSMVAWGPMLDPGVTRQLVTTAGETINWPTMDDTSTVAAIIGENSEVTTPGDLAFGQKSLGAFKYTTGLIKVSLELAQDNIVNLESVIRDAMAERLGRGVNAHLTTGGGTSVPWGIVTRSVEGHEAPDVSSVVTLTFDDMIELEHSVDPSYRADPSCAWMFNDSTLKVLRKLKDLEGRYIWQPADAATGARPTILGYRYVVNQAMDGVVAADRSVTFGAMNRYIVRRVRELSIARLDERYAEFGQVAFIGFARFDGELMDTAAVKHIVQET